MRCQSGGNQNPGVGFISTPHPTSGFNTLGHLPLGGEGLNLIASHAGGLPVKPAGFPQAGGLPLEGKLAAEFKRRLTDEVSKLLPNQTPKLVYLNTSSDLGL